MKGTLSLLFVTLLVLAVVGEEFKDVFPKATEQDQDIIAQIQARDPLPVFSPLPLVQACPKLEAPAPTNSIYSLKPGHIKVVMAMGDSITAAMSAKDITVISLKEYRGISFPIGGDAKAVTMPNIMKGITGVDLVGTSLGIGKRDASGSGFSTGFNAAVSGAISIEMPPQAEYLVKQLKANKNIDFENDWKVLSIFIGSNNLCDVCEDAANNNAVNYHKYMIATLDYIKANVPRVFVNLLADLDITQIYNIKDGLCATLHPIECGCAASSNATTRANVKKEVINFQIMADTIANHYAAMKLEDFAVVVQPFMTESYVFDRSYLSPADCFHPSAISHAIAAAALWNNMISPKADKQTAWEKAGTVLCPNSTTLLYTN